VGGWVGMGAGGWAGGAWGGGGLGCVEGGGVGERTCEGGVDGGEEGRQLLDEILVRPAPPPPAAPLPHLPHTSTRAGSPGEVCHGRMGGEGGGREG
jgi:hypothetical protein